MASRIIIKIKLWSEIVQKWLQTKKRESYLKKILPKNKWEAKMEINKVQLFQYSFDTAAKVAATVAATAAPAWLNTFFQPHKSLKQKGHLRDWPDFRHPANSVRKLESSWALMRYYRLEPRKAECVPMWLPSRESHYSGWWQRSPQSREKPSTLQDLSLQKWVNIFGSLDAFCGLWTNKSFFILTVKTNRRLTRRGYFNLSPGCRMVLGVFLFHQIGNPQTE